MTNQSCCAFCGYYKDGTRKFVQGVKGHLICDECIKELKKEVDLLRFKRPDEEARVD